MKEIIIYLFILLINKFILSNNPNCYEYSCQECNSEKYGDCIKCKNNFILLKDGTCKHKFKKTKLVNILNKYDKKYIKRTQEPFCAEESIDGKCIECKRGYSLINNKCLKCGLNCSKCIFYNNTKSKYLECQNKNYIIKEDICINKKFSRNLSRCDVENCFSCDYFGKKCQSCWGGYHLKDNKCIRDTPDPDMCHFKISWCWTCKNSTACQECFQSYKLVNGNCEKDDTDEVDIAAIMSIVISCVLVVIIIIVCVFCVWRCHERCNNNNNNNDRHNNMNNNNINVNINNQYNNNVTLPRIPSRILPEEKKTDEKVLEYEFFTYNIKNNDTYSNDNINKECNICLKNVNQLSNFKCGCAFVVCKDCYIKWKNKSDKCPGCRANI